MKVLFVGPSLPDVRLLVSSDVVIKAPATQGDIQVAVNDGASAIGLVDGGFEYTASVWHKEILYGLSQGVQILGAASMGALRAAECHTFGMIGVGRIFEDYRDGIAIDDADVALLHAPPEMDYLALTVPMVNVRATLQHAMAKAGITLAEAETIRAVADAIFFKDRTWKDIVTRCDGLELRRKVEISELIASSQVDQKRLDAIALVERLSLGKFEDHSKGNWHFERTSIWREIL